MAYPGSPLHRQATETGQKLPDSYAGYSQHAYETQNLSNSNLKAEVILRFRDAAWTRYNTDPNYLQLLENKFGTHARQNLEDASKIILKRKILGD
jgi:anaerobic magnesium-protoporphyrin IX monomethyl ester cyclase